MGRGGKSGIAALARASGRVVTATRGRLFRFGNERATPSVFLLNNATEAVSLPPLRCGTRTAPLHGATQTDALRAGLWASGRPARREARVPAGQRKNAAPSGAQSAGQSATFKSPAQLTLLIVTRMGRDYRPGPQQRIERVARRAAQWFSFAASIQK